MVCRNLRRFATTCDGPSYSDDESSTVVDFGLPERLPGVYSRSTTERKPTMKYLCLAYGEEEKMNALSKSEMDALVSRCQIYDQELQKSGHLISGMSLGWGSTILRLRNGKLSITDGPYAATKEVVGGLVLIEARDQ